MDIDSFHNQKNDGYKFILIDEAMFDKNETIDSTSKILFFDRPIDVASIIKYFRENS